MPLSKASPPYDALRQESLHSGAVMLDRLDETMGFYHQALNLRSKRQEVLSSNIANADTPGYKARDFDFTAALKNATDGRGVKPLRNTELVRTNAAHIPARAVAVPAAPLLYRVPTQPAVDGNTVDMDVERVGFADNTVRHQSTLTLLSSRIKAMLSAVQQ